MDVEMRKIMAVDGGDGAHGATGSPQAKLLRVVGVIAGSGFIAGLLGIGGALIFNPFLLQLGVHPQARNSAGYRVGCKVPAYHALMQCSCG